MIYIGRIMEKLSKMVIIIAVSVMIIIATSVFAYADDCIIGRTPDGIYPINDNDIIMTDEDIYIDVENGKAICKFEFKNTGEAKDITMGFPGQGKKKYDDLYTPMENLRVVDFKTFIDDKLISSKLEEGIEPAKQNTDNNLYYENWYTFNVHFQKGEIKKIKNTYTFISTYYSNGDVHTGYIIDTGSVWKGNICHAKVSFDMGSVKPYMIVDISPCNNFRFEGTNLVWECSDFEPDQNLQIMYNTYHSSKEFLENIADENYKKQVDDIKKNYEDIENALKTEDMEKIKALYDAAIRNNDKYTEKYIYDNALAENIKDNNAKTAEDTENTLNDDNNDTKTCTDTKAGGDNAVRKVMAEKHENFLTSKKSRLALVVLVSAFVVLGSLYYKRR